MPTQPAAASPALAYLLLRNSLKLYDKPWQQLTAAEQETARSEAEEEYRLQQLVMQTEEAAGVFIAPTIPAEALGMIRQRFADPESFRREMESHGLNEETLLQAITDELRVEGALSVVGQRGGTPGEDEIVVYYQNNPERFHIPELRKARHILITINDDFPDNTRHRARKRIEAIHAQLMADPTRFDELVHSRSECPSALRNGELGEVPEGKLFPALNQVLFALEEGAISAIIESHLGFHIVLCEAIKPTRSLSFDEAKAQIQALLTRRRQQRAQKEWLKAIHTKIAPSS